MALIVICKYIETDINLMKVAHAFTTFGWPAANQSGKQHCSKNGGNGYYNQHFNQGKSGAPEI